MNKYTIVICISFFLFAETYANEKYNSSNKNVEVIEIKGQKPLSRLREEYKQAKLAVFETFNALIEDPDMHYICEKRRLPNSRISYTPCQDAFDIRIRDELFTREMNKSGDLITKLYRAQTSSDMGTFEIKRLKNKKDGLVKKLAEENEIFKKALIELSTAKSNYEQAHISKYGTLSRFEEEK